MTVIHRLPGALPALALASLLALLVGCDESESGNDRNQADTAWRERCAALESKVAEERNRTEQALQGQARLRSAMGWWGMGAAVCLIAGVILGSTTKRLAQGGDADDEADEADDRPEAGTSAVDPGRDGP